MFGAQKPTKQPAMPEHLQRDPAGRGEAVLGVQEQGIVDSRSCWPKRDRVGAERIVEPAAALGRQIGAEIFVQRDRIADRAMQPLEVGDRVGADPGQLVAPLEDRDIAAAPGLLRAQRGDEIGARLLGPVGARLDHAAGGDRADRHVGAHHEQFVIALRRRELEVGKLARLDAAGERSADAGERDSHDDAYEPPHPLTATAATVLPQH